MVTSIVNSLGGGSGLDVPKLIADLAAASRDPKVAQLDKRQDAVKASISAVTQARSDLDGFASSLASLVSGGTLQSQPTVSDTSILDAKAKAGARLGNFSGSIEVTQLARAQTSASAYFASATTSIGSGTLKLTVGSTTTDINIAPGSDDLNGIAAAINAANTGVTANVLTDGSGARLVMKGATGVASAFSLSTLTPALLAFTGGVSQIQSAQDAQFKVDGLSYTRGSNTVDDVVTGVSLTLKKVAVGSPVTLGTQRIGDTLKTTLTDFVSVFNELKGHIADARTKTNSDQALRQLDRQLAALVSQSVTSYGYPSSLSAIGIKTQRDGTISFDEAAFNTAYAANPDAVEAIFSPTRDATHTYATDPGIATALTNMKAALGGSSGALTSLTTRLSKQQDSIVGERERMETRETAYKARLEKQFGGLDAKVGAFKATQNYLDQQIKMWTASK